MGGRLPPTIVPGGSSLVQSWGIYITFLCNRKIYASHFLNPKCFDTGMAATPIFISKAIAKNRKLVLNLGLMQKNGRGHLKIVERSGRLKPYSIVGQLGRPLGSTVQASTSLIHLKQQVRVRYRTQYPILADLRYINHIDN